MQNLAIVFGPTLFGQPVAVNDAGGATMPDTFHQNLVRLHICLAHNGLFYPALIGD